MVWPTGQRRRPLPVNLQFDPGQLRAGRAMLDVSRAHLAAWAGGWPRGVHVTEEDVRLAELGQEISPTRYEAICWALNDDGAGVIGVPGGNAGAGVRLALNPERRAARLRDRKNRALQIPQAAREELQLRDHGYIAAMTWLYGPHYWLRHDVRISLWRPEMAADWEHSRTNRAGIDAGRVSA